MTVRHHQIVAILILIVGLGVVTAWGRSTSIDPADVQAIRERFQGHWVAELAQAGEHRRAEGQAAEECRAEFDGKNVVFHHLIDGIEARGTFYLDRDVKKGWVDFKLDAGWVIGLYEVTGDRLTLCVNAFALPERLGVPTRPRPRKIKAGDDRHLYVFRKVTTDR